ncbi:hypothetical protein SS50377_25427 [Spironucleus salmonicida]|uniref:Uncharacterized protein n=1 Tax=Spironucleus salmonicida TaxID=348837 RepID=V6LKS8_9EUKA|nr:hypothetical protein SS50377_25427 [Spironucleus salmonicida]|eukprot:EST44973.1 Hypothetical protein SS50377_14992 [Spironucleus salmonicida]
MESYDQTLKEQQKFYQNANKHFLQFTKHLINAQNSLQQLELQFEIFSQQYACPTALKQPFQSLKNLTNYYQQAINLATDNFGQAAQNFDVGPEFKSINVLLKAVKATKQSQDSNIEFIKGCAAFECERARAAKDFAINFAVGSAKLCSKVLGYSGIVNQSANEINLNDVICSVARRFSGLDVGGDIETVLGVKNINNRVKSPKGNKKQLKSDKSQKSSGIMQKTVTLHTGDSICVEAESPQFTKQFEHTAISPAIQQNQSQQIKVNQNTQFIGSPQHNRILFQEGESIPGPSQAIPIPRMLLVDDEEIEPIIKNTANFKPKICIPRYNFDDSLMDDKEDQLLNLRLPTQAILSINQPNLQLPNQPETNIMSTEELKKQIDNLRQLESELLRSSNPTIDIPQ